MFCTYLWILHSTFWKISSGLQNNLINLHILMCWLQSSKLKSNNANGNFFKAIWTFLKCYDLLYQSSEMNDVHKYYSTLTFPRRDWFIENYHQQSMPGRYWNPFFPMPKILKRPDLYMEKILGFFCFTCLVFFCFNIEQSFWQNFIFIISAGSSSVMPRVKQSHIMARLSSHLTDVLFF